jgi:drug/metabolite transporter (DMT)-like permease
LLSKAFLSIVATNFNGIGATMTTLNKTMGSLEWLLLIILSILWGGSFFFVGVAVKALPPLTIVVLRVGLAALALNLVVRVSGLQMPREWPLWKAFFGMGLLNNMIPFCLIVWGQTHIASGLASIFNATTPLFTVLVAHAFTKDEKLTGGRLSGILVGFAGVAVIIGPDSLDSLGTNTLAQFAVLGAALSYALAGVYGRRFKAMGSAPLVTATGQVTASAILLGPIMLLVDQPWNLSMPSLPVWAAVLGLALVSTALAYIIYFRILATAGATNLLLVTFLIPVSAILLGAIFLGEQLAIKDFAGMGLICLGLAAIDGRFLKLITYRQQ